MPATVVPAALVGQDGFVRAPSCTTPAPGGNLLFAARARALQTLSKTIASLNIDLTGQTTINDMILSSLTLLTILNDCSPGKFTAEQEDALQRTVKSLRNRHPANTTLFKSIHSRLHDISLMMAK